MSARRALLLHARLSTIARHCQVAHQRTALALAGSGGWSAAPHMHETAGHALQLAASSAARQQASWSAGRGFAADAAPMVAEDDSAVELEITSAAVERLGELAAETPGQPLVLRLMVEGGGCSGFTYHFILGSNTAPDDRVVSKGQAMLVCDPVSYEFVRGSIIDYTTEIIRSAFEVVSNPNAEASCGCGSSFAPKG